MKKLLAASVLALTLLTGEVKAQPSNVTVSMYSNPFGTYTGNLVLAQARVTHSGVPTLYFWYGVQDSTSGNVFLDGTAVTPASGDTYEVSYSFLTGGYWHTYGAVTFGESEQGNPMGPGVVCEGSSTIVLQTLTCPVGSYPTHGTGSSSGYLVSGSTLYVPPGPPSTTPPFVRCCTPLPALPTGVLNASCGS